MMYQSYEGMDTEGTVLRIEKSSIFDGEGLRTVVFLKGCPLRCKWCSTPESYQTQIQTTLDGTIIYGKTMTVEEVMTEVRKDSLFYFHSGGGVTLSGGEILTQSRFAYNILRRSCFEGINTTIETSFYGDWTKIEPILECTDTAFVDLKLMDSKMHKDYTGVDNELILRNIKMAEKNKRSNLEIIIRRPLIPGVNDSKEELTALGLFLGELNGIKCLQLLPYHRLGTDTYRKLGMEYPLAKIDVPDDEHMMWCRSITEKYIKTII